MKDRYVIVPNSRYINWGKSDYLKKYPQAKICKEGFNYNSENNPDFLSVGKIKKILSSLKIDYLRSNSFVFDEKKSNQII